MVASAGMRRLAVTLGVLILLACPKEKEPGGTATAVESTTGGTGGVGTTGAATTTTGVTTGDATTMMMDVTGSTGATGGSTGEECVNNECDCAPGEMCVQEWFTGGQMYCRPNPDGCVARDVCSPACKALCGDLVCLPLCQMLLCKEPITCWVGYPECDDGMKCVPYDALEKGTLNGTLCQPLDPAPAGVGEPCTRDDQTGADSCDAETLCIDGTCKLMCVPEWQCPVGMVCVNHIDFVLPLCEPACDPLMPLCAAGELCVPSFDAFACVADKSGAEGQAGDPCEYLSACDLGLECTSPANVPGCAPDNAGCCSPYCDVTLPNTCPVPGQSCVPYFGQDPPPGFETLGICGVP